MKTLSQRYKADFSLVISGKRASGFRRWLLLVTLGALWLFSAPVLGSVIVYDQITAPNQPVFLKVQTRGLLFTEGGRRVTLSVNDGQTLNLLTGGDGFGYVKYMSSVPGRFAISADSIKPESNAILLVVSPNESIILLDFEMLLKRMLQKPDEKHTAQQVLSTLPPDCHLVYVIRYLGSVIAKRWLEAQSFPRGVTLGGKLSDMYDALKNKSFRIRAIIGPADAMDGSIDDSTHQLTFDDTKIGTTVENWNQIQDILTEAESK